MMETLRWPIEKSLMYQKPWHLLYCWVQKVASSSWSRVFYQLAGIQVPASRLHEATQQFSPSHTDLPIALANSLVFTVVRHPFERLVSAYRDKFELAKKSAYVYTMYAPKILKNSKHRLTSPRPTFLQFVDYLIETPVSEYNDHWIPYWLH